MKKPDIPPDEEERLRSLASFEVLDTAAEEEYDALVKLAAYVAQTPIALISLVDRDRQWFKASVGLSAEQTGRDESFCAHAIADRARLVVHDAHEDARFSDNPLVVAAPFVRFYAGSLLVSSDDQALGTLCVIDHEPRELTEKQHELLELLAAQASRLLELRRIARWLHESRDEAEAVWTASLDPICVASFDGYFQRLNPAWSSTLGFSNEELKAAPFGNFVHPDDLELVMNETALLRQGHDSRNFVARFRTSTGEYRALQFNSTADIAAQTYTAVARDVTEDRKILSELAEARAAAEAANRAKSTFLASMSHELRTPLNSVIGFSRVLLKNKAQNLQPKQTEYLERIQRNGSHLLSLLNDVLDLSKIEVGHIDLEIEDVSISDVVKAAHMSLEPGDVKLTVEIPPGDLMPIPADARRLHQILVNLLGNAIKFSPEGSVTTRAIAKDGRIVRLEIIDDGIGIEPDALNRIFEPFEQAESGTERRYGGTGLGLPIARTLARSMGFELLVRSAPGEGSTFTLEFGTSSPQAAVQQPQRRAQLTPKDTKSPVLIVDDEPESRLLLEAAIADLGFPVVAVDTPSLALRIAEVVRPRAVLLDLMMPDVDGFSVLRQFEAHPFLAEVPVIVVSVSASENRTKLVHAHAILDKPVAPESLAEVLGGSTHVLIVDDDADARALVREVVSEIGATFREAENGHEGLARLTEEMFDAVVLDLGMPVMDGYQFLRSIRARDELRDLPVVVYSASGELTAGPATSVVKKSGDLAQLRVALETALSIS